VTETGISEIEVSVSSTFNRKFKPYKGVVKWFKVEEIGLVFFKFRVEDGNNTIELVFPSERLVCVTYPKELD
jgi:hypothetical protein